MTSEPKMTPCQERMHMLMGQITIIIANACGKKHNDYDAALEAVEKSIGALAEVKECIERKMERGQT